MMSFRKRISDARGFNLIELMIVIAIIGLLIAVGGWGWQAMMRSGNETAAAQTIEKIKIFQAQYAGKTRKFGTFDQLITTVGMDENFRGERPVVNGYVFTMEVTEQTPSKPAFYSVTADPQIGDGVSATGNIHYYTDSNLGTIKRTDENRSAKADDPSL